MIAMVSHQNSDGCLGSSVASAAATTVAVVPPPADSGAGSGSLSGSDTRSSYRVGTTRAHAFRIAFRNAPGNEPPATRTFLALGRPHGHRRGVRTAALDRDGG